MKCELDAVIRMLTIPLHEATKRLVAAIPFLGEDTSEDAYQDALEMVDLPD